MITVTLILLFISIVIMLIITQVQVNHFVKSTYELIEKVESHIYL